MQMHPESETLVFLRDAGMGSRPLPHLWRALLAWIERCHQASYPPEDVGSVRGRRQSRKDDWISSAGKGRIQTMLEMTMEKLLWWLWREREMQVSIANIVILSKNNTTFTANQISLLCLPPLYLCPAEICNGCRVSPNPLNSIRAICLHTVCRDLFNVAVFFSKYPASIRPDQQVFFFHV